MAEIHSITVYLGATIPKNPIYVDAVRKLGRLMAAHGLTLVFGGSKEGTMEILADEILHNGGKAVGIFTDSLPAEFLYPGLTETVVVHDLADRKNLMRERGDAIIALPGSFGTMVEAFNWMEKWQLGWGQKPAFILNTDGYYDGLLAQFKKMIAAGFMDGDDMQFLTVCPTPEALVNTLLSKM